MKHTHMHMCMQKFIHLLTHVYMHSEGITKNEKKIPCKYIDPEIVEKLEREVFEPGSVNFYLISWSSKLSIYKRRT